MTTISAPAEPEPEPAEASNPFGDDGGERTSVANIAQLEQLRDQARTPQKPAHPESSAQWFAMVKGAQQGPFDLRSLGAKFQTGELHARTFMWKQGMGDWKRADELPDLSSALKPAAPPPPPPAAPKAPPRVAPQAPRIAEPIRDEPSFDREFEQAEVEAKPRAPEPEPVPEPAPRPSLDTLFSDEDLPPPDAKAEKKEEIDDPFAALGGTLDPSAVPAPGEATRFFMQQAGVDKGQRNPKWKIALFVVLLLGLPVGALYLLSELHVVPLQVSSVNEQGQEVKTSVFTGAGVKGLGDLLLGRNKKAQDPAPVVAPPPVKKKEPVAKKEEAAVAEKDPNQPSQEDLAALYNDDRIDSKGPKLKIAAEKPALQKNVEGGLGEEEVVKVVGQSQAAFQSCIELELKKNPNLKVGKIVISATVAPSGAVTKAEIDKREVAMSNLGECLKSRARRMVFARFEGDETELQIPLMVTSSF